MAGWLGFCVFALLKDHAAAWVLFGALYFGGMRAAELLAQPAAQDRAAGWSVAILVILAAAALLAGRRSPATSGVPVPVPIEPDLPPPPGSLEEP